MISMHLEEGLEPSTYVLEDPTARWGLMLIQKDIKNLKMYRHTNELKIKHITESINKLIYSVWGA
jgi:hypothetical protein